MALCVSSADNTYLILGSNAVTITDTTGEKVKIRLDNNFIRPEFKCFYPLRIRSNYN